MPRPNARGQDTSHRESGVDWASTSGCSRIALGQGTLLGLVLQAVQPQRQLVGSHPGRKQPRPGA